MKSLLLCANIQVRGVYTSENVYDYVTLPTDLRFKFAFDINKWEEHFDFISLPENLDRQNQKSQASAVKHGSSKKEGVEDENKTRA